MSIIVALAFRWDGQRCRLFLQTRGGSYNTDSIVAFLTDLHAAFLGNASS